jgi:hypothetical protein
MRYLFLSAAVLALAAAGRADEKPKPRPLPGWFNVMPRLLNYDLRFEAPEVGEGEKPTVYRQTARYEWMGNDYRIFNVTLARDPAFKEKYAAETVKKDKPAPEETKVGKYAAWSWDLSKEGERKFDKVNSRQVVILAEDKVLIVEAFGSPRAQHWADAAQGLDLEKLAAALDAPPRSKPRSSADEFTVFGRDVTWGDVAAWMGPPDEDVGSGIHVLVYKLADGSRVVVGTPDYKKVVYLKHEAKDGTKSDLLK